MKAVISSCDGIGVLERDADYIVHKVVANGMLVVAVDVPEEFADGTAREIAQRIISKWEEKPELTEEQLENTLQVGMQASSKVSVTVLMLEEKQIGVAHQGNNKLFHILERQIDDMTMGEEGSRIIDIYEYHAKPEDAFVLMTDGVAEYIREQEVLIDYTKSRTPKELISYLGTRVGLRQREDYESYAMVALFFE